MPDPITALEAIERARKIVPRVAATSARSEELRRLDDDAVAALREQRLASLLTPRRFGGFELSPRAHLLAVAELGHGCSAASWVLMVCGAHTYVAGRFPEPCQQEVFGPDPDVLIAGTLSPQGVVRATDGGWVLNGRWQFGSGCDHAPWLLIGARVHEPKPGAWKHYHVIVPTREIALDDTWHTLGMRGTGSKDLVAKDVFVPAHRATPTRPSFIGDCPQASSALYRLPVLGALSSMVAASVLGIAERGFEQFARRARERRDPLGGTKAENPVVQARFSESRAELQAARLLLVNLCDRFEEVMKADAGPLPVEKRLELRADAAYVVELCQRALARLFAAAGAHAIYDEPSELQRIHRDLGTATHHAIVDYDSISQLAGAVTLGLDVGEDPLGFPFA
ncbi:MAG TPA: acyl-CoA dehydrogenase family protein [Myxococcota bacterium]|nr:acyl-CoA dehydrogenase family protein [Myxococcota bacterium]